MPEESVNNVLVSESRAFSLHRHPQSNCEGLTGSLHVVALDNTCFHFVSFSMSACFKRVERRKTHFSTAVSAMVASVCELGFMLNLKESVIQKLSLKFLEYKLSV